MTTEVQDLLAQLLTVAAASVGDCFAAAGLDSHEYAFTLTLWPVGKPTRVSTICGCGTSQGQQESATALFAASEKAAKPPTHTTLHKSEPPGRPH